jgi:hypothetical protein
LLIVNTNSITDAASQPPVEAPADNEIFELPGDEPEQPEAGGRELSEKEAMRVREEKYNGVNPNPTTPSKSSNRIVGHSPISPITPGTSTNMTTRTEESVISPVSAAAIHRTISQTLASNPRRKTVNGTEIEPISEATGLGIRSVEPAQNLIGHEKRFSWEA